MTWTPPITWAPNQLMTMQTLNEQIAGNFSYLTGPDRCQVTNSGAQAISTTSTLLTWDTNTAISNPAMHAVGTNPSRLIAATAGTYRLRMALGTSLVSTLAGVDVRKNAAGSNSGGTRVAYFNANGLAIASGLFTGSADMIALAANDYLEVFASATTGTPNIISGTYGTFVDFRWVGV